MTEVLFYHLQGQPIEKVLPTLLERSLQRGWRVVVQAASDERVDALDSHLWTYNDASFLPHAQAGDGSEARQPVLITVEDANPNAANVLFLVGGAGADWNATAGLTRIVMMFDGRDADALGRARAAWKDAKAAGHDVTYWKETPGGKFEKQN